MWIPLCCNNFIFIPNFTSNNFIILQFTTTISRVQRFSYKNIVTMSILGLMYLYHTCVSRISPIIWLARCNAWNMTNKKMSKLFSPMWYHVLVVHVGENSFIKFIITSSISAASFLRWPICSDSERSDAISSCLYKDETNSDWRLSLT